MNLATLLTSASELFFTSNQNEFVELDEETTFTAIDLHGHDDDNDIEEEEEEEEEQTVVESVDEYYYERFRFVPTRASDLLLGAAYLSEEWYLPREHPLARLLLKNDYEPISRELHSQLLRYNHKTVALSQQSLVQLMKDKGSNMSEEGALWTLE